MSNNLIKAKVLKRYVKTVMWYDEISYMTTIIIAFSVLRAKICHLVYNT
jgi:hypothetical protein